MENRREQIRQQRERELQRLAAQERVREVGSGGPSNLWFLDAYVPSESERESLSTLEAHVAELLGTERENLIGPTAEITCIRDRTKDRLRAYEESSGMGVTVAVEDGTATLQFDVLESGEPTMDAGDAMAWPLAAACRFPVGDMRVSLFWKTQTGTGS